jgi:hypothetical protein
MKDPFEVVPAALKAVITFSVRNMIRAEQERLAVKHYREMTASSAPPAEPAPTLESIAESIRALEATAAKTPVEIVAGRTALAILRVLAARDWLPGEPSPWAGVIPRDWMGLRATVDSDLPAGRLEFRNAAGQVVKRFDLLSEGNTE